MARKRSTARSEEEIGQAASEVDLDLKALETRCENVLRQPLYWFPVRHHSPTVALYVETVMRARKPKVVFIEGPAEANHLIPHIVDARTKPPVAIYSSYRDDDNVLGLAGIASAGPDIPPRFPCWYPLLGYSPEYVAINTAAKLGAEVVFIDLPHHALIQPAGPPEQAAPQTQPDGKQPTEPEDERLIVESSFYASLARAAGYRSWSEAWDTLFETRPRGEDPEDFRRELAFFCGAARATTNPARMRSDGTLERERHMMRSIRETLARKKLRPEEGMVICGGFHLFLDPNDAEPPPEPPEGTVYTTVVPYSFFRISELSGYGAGNRAPQFYHQWYELASKGRVEDIVVEYVVTLLKQARRGGEGLSSADAIAICQHAEMLARLRGRRGPVLDDIHDAVMTCCCKGNPQEEGIHLLRAMDAAGIGTRLGQVTTALGRLPIVTDFHNQLAAHDLGEVLQHERRIAFDLDKRQAEAQKRSLFFHRLRFLGVPLAVWEDESGEVIPGGQIFRERWALKWSPQVEPALVELSLHGDTVETAALARLREHLATDIHQAGRCCQRLVQAINMDFPNLIQEVEEAASQAIDSDSSFTSLSSALASLMVLDRYAVYRSLRREVLNDLLVRCFDRACFAIPDVASVPEDQQKEVVGSLLTLAEIVQREQREGIDKELFAEHVRIAANVSSIPFLRGVFLGLLTELREMTPEELAAEVSSLARGPAEIRLTAGDFFDGIMAVSRTSIMVGAGPLIGALDELLRATDWDGFLVMLPRLRGAFERLHDAQKDSLAGRVAERYGLKEAETLTELRTSVEAAARIARIDQQVALIMEHWDF